MTMTTIKRLIFLGMGEVGFQTLAALLAQESASALLKNVQIVMIDGDRVETRNPSYRGWAEGVYKVAVAGIRAATELDVPVFDAPNIPLHQKKGVYLVAKFVTLKELDFALDDEGDLLVETADTFVLQNTLGLHIHTGMVRDQLVFGIRWGQYKLHGDKADPDCPDRLHLAAVGAGRRAAPLILDILAGKIENNSVNIAEIVLENA